MNINGLEVDDNVLAALMLEAAAEVPFDANPALFNRVFDAKAQLLMANVAESEDA